jgi:hypothetical protein
MMQILMLGFLYFTYTSQSVAADGPENTGLLTIGAVNGNQFEANFQVDQKIFRAFDQKSIDRGGGDLTSIFSVKSFGTICTRKENASVESNEVLTKSLNFTCEHDPHTLTITLLNIESLPDGFTLGVRSPIDHFVLTKASHEADTIIKTEYAFGLAGITLFFKHSIQEKTHVGRPHAFFFGGLTAIPPGFYFLFIFLALWLTGLSSIAKMISSILLMFFAAAITIYITQFKASLSLLPVRSLGVLYLGSTFCALICSFKKEKLVAHWAAFFFIVVGVAAAGMEIAVILRWLEGQEQLNTAKIIVHFYIGFALPLGTISILGLILTRHSENFRKFLAPAFPVTKIALLSASLYTLVALIFKLP